MSWHFLLRRKFVPYLEGELQPREAKRVERHLLDCPWCRGVLVRLRAGHQMAQRLQAFDADEHPRPEFEAVITAVQPLSRTGRRAPLWEDWFDRLATPRAASALAALVLVQLALLVVSNRGVLFGKHSSVSLKAGALDLGDFRQLSIRELKSNTRPHVATEGYVYDVRTDPEEGTVAFKLAESADPSAPFVVCEIMSPIEMPAPQERSYVRVYGVARYDAQTDRKWYEVNPVLNIAVLKR
ncbi:MAG TPA: zf-HC2 domain-containing protein [Terriglobia bacterium]